jgi:membrane fusion protein (multidrug efflux system)
MMTINRILALGCGLALLAACSEEPASIGNGVSSDSVMQVDYVVVQPRPVANQISITGTLMPAESALLSAQSSGLIEEIYFREGEWVKKGQALLKLDDRQWVVQKEKLAAQLETAKKDAARKRELLAIKGISQAEVDDAELLIESIIADQKELDVRIDYAVVRAPFSGMIGLRNVSPGSYLGAGDPVARLVQVDPLKLEFNVPERYADQVREGQTVRFSLSSDERVYEARVYATEPVINESTRSLRIRARVPNRDRELIAGAFTQVNLTLDSIPDALLIPTETVVPVLNDQVVYRVKNGMVEEVIVKPGIRLPRLIQIESGLSVGDTIMVSGLLQAKNGLPVRAGKEISVSLTNDISAP